MTYTTMPSVSRFQSDTSITFAFRKEDPIISHLDWLLERYHAANHVADYSKRRVILCDLFLTCNYWIKGYHDRNPGMKKERYNGVLALFEAVVDTLCMLLQCKRGQVAQMLDEIYGRDLHTHGLIVDLSSERAKYFSKKERQNYRLRFKGGLAYQYQWWLNDAPAKLVPADSSHAYTDMVRTGHTNEKVSASENFGDFIMTLERELYMAKHWVGDAGSRAGTFHSSYTAGERVIMAGTMLIQGGFIKAIRSDSGHYKPTEMNMSALLQGLGMFGVNLAAIQLYDFKGGKAGNALDFLKAHVSWDQFLKQRKNEIDHRIEGDSWRFGRGGEKKFPHLQPPQDPNVPPMTGENFYMG